MITFPQRRWKTFYTLVLRMKSSLWLCIYGVKSSLACWQRINKDCCEEWFLVVWKKIIISWNLFIPNVSLIVGSYFIFHFYSSRFLFLAWEETCWRKISGISSLKKINTITTDYTEKKKTFLLMPSYLFPCQLSYHFFSLTHSPVCLIPYCHCPLINFIVVWCASLVRWMLLKMKSPLKKWYKRNPEKGFNSSLAPSLFSRLISLPGHFHKKQ